MVSSEREQDGCENRGYGRCHHVYDDGVHTVSYTHLDVYKRQTFDIEMERLPIQQAAIEYAQMGLIPAGAYRNRNFTEEKIETGNVEEHLLDIFFDPQTSGGLLVSAAPDVAEKIIEEMDRAEMATAFGIIGTVTEKQEKYVRLR